MGAHSRYFSDEKWALRKKLAIDFPYTIELTVPNHGRQNMQRHMIKHLYSWLNTKVGKGATGDARDGPYYVTRTQVGVMESTFIVMFRDERDAMMFKLSFA